MRGTITGAVWGLLLSVVGITYREWRFYVLLLAVAVWTEFSFQLGRRRT